MSVQSRRIRKLLVANRGEIAARILGAAQELGIQTFALYTQNDTGHTHFADRSIELEDPSSYMSIDRLLHIVKENGIDAIHPGYGFLSESAALSQRMSEADVLVVGPGAEVLSQTADKLRARSLAESCGVPVLPALTEPTNDMGKIDRFVSEIGLPVMIKAVDGGGGRGIRLVHTRKELFSLARRAIEESPSRQVFVEMAAIQGYQHVEVQIIGDGHGRVIHLWERECSVQRRYQKMIELAPCRAIDRGPIAKLIESAVRMAKAIRYRSLGTFEYLFHPESGKFYFLEINPRLQVEHTVTESICDVDLVKAQLRLAQGFPIGEIGLGSAIKSAVEAPDKCSIQLRITAEDPQRNFLLSTGKIDQFWFPSGNGIRVDNALVSGYPAIIGTQFDSLIAKLIVTDRTWPDVIQKARRVLSQIVVRGVTTNLSLLAIILQHPDFDQGRYDTRWLEERQAELMVKAREWQATAQAEKTIPSQPSQVSTSTAGSVGSLRKGDAWSVEFASASSSGEAASSYHVQLQKIIRNEFPESFSAEATITAAGQAPQLRMVRFQSTNSSAAAASSDHQKGDRLNSDHVIVPFAGSLVEVTVDVGDFVREGDVICIVRQMKMELEVRSRKSGICSWLIEAEDGEDLAENTLAAIITDKDGSKL